MYMMTWTGPPSSQPSKWGRRQFTPLSLFAQNIAHCSEKSANCTAKHTITTKQSTNYNIIYDTKNSFSSSSLTKHFSEYCKRYCRIQLVLSFVFLICLCITTLKCGSSEEIHFISFANKKWLPPHISSQWEHAELTRLDSWVTREMTKNLHFFHTSLLNRVVCHNCCTVVRNPVLFKLSKNVCNHISSQWEQAEFTRLGS